MNVEWISVEDKLPEPFIYVLCTYNDGYEPNIVNIGCLFSGGSWLYEDTYGKVTHWMPMPKPAED